MVIEFAQPNLAGKAVRLCDMRLVSGATPLLAEVNITLEYGSHTVIVGGNGAGKTSLLSVLATERFPTSGTAEILGHRMGTVDVRDIRTRIGVITARQRVYSGQYAQAHTVVLTGFSGSAVPLWERYSSQEHARADELLEIVGCSHVRDRHVSLLSQGELSRIKLARALMADPLLLLLDEPYTGLDIPAREDMLATLDALYLSHPYLTSVLVTHFLEEIPPKSNYAILLKQGRILYSGIPHAILTSEKLSHTFDRPITVHTTKHGRYFAAVEK